MILSVSVLKILFSQVHLDHLAGVALLGHQDSPAQLAPQGLRARLATLGGLGSEVWRASMVRPASRDTQEVLAGGVPQVDPDPQVNFFWHETWKEVIPL